MYSLCPVWPVQNASWWQRGRCWIDWFAFSRKRTLWHVRIWQKILSLLSPVLCLSQGDWKQRLFFSIGVEIRPGRADDWMCAIYHAAAFCCLPPADTAPHALPSPPAFPPAFSVCLSSLLLPSVTELDSVTHHHSLFCWTLCRPPRDPRFHISRGMTALTAAGSRF